MRIIVHPKKKKLKGCVVALGTFDGVHRGHQKLIAGAVKYASAAAAASLVITFDPHPQRLILPERGLQLLTTLKERERLFCKYGVDGVVVFRFSHRVQRLSYERFVKKYLVDRLGVACVFVGFDFAFGEERRGGVVQLKELGEKYGFAVQVVPAVLAGGQAIKSRTIRDLVSKGKFQLAIKLLGHPYQITGRVVKGAGRGQKLGFPTANLALDPDKLIPSFGVYAGYLTLGKKTYKCCVNLGARPTFGVGEATVEAHIIGYKGNNLRGKVLKIMLVHYLRPELHFSDVEDLQRQIRRDVNFTCGRVKINI
jgi:riboflavin kinase/FMN adenylyltransferase